MCEHSFTRALTGDSFSAGDAVALTQALVGRVDRGNLNRDLARIEGLGSVSVRLPPEF